MKVAEQLALLSLAEEVGGLGHWRFTVATSDLYWSPAVYRIHGRDPANFTPSLSNAVDAYHPDDRDRVRDLVARAIERRESFEFQLRILRPNGEVRMVDSSGRCLCDETGAVESVFGVFQDVTDRFSALMRRNEELEHFSRVLAHDLRAPLNTVLGFGELLARAVAPGAPANPRAPLYAQKMLEQTARMRELVTELARSIASTSGDEGWQPVSLDHVVDHAVDALSREIADSGAVIVKGELPTVVGLPHQLRQLFQNLLQNAIKFAKPGLAPRIEVTSEARSSRIAVVVTDHGVGLPAAGADDIFRPFRRLASEVPSDGSMGMGLAICRRIMANHGGEITASSNGDEGTKFTALFSRAS